MPDKYKIIGRSYDLLSKLYSANAIEECKLSMLRGDTIKPGMKVLFAGAGHGKDAIRAAELGAKVFIVDISPTMISAFTKNLDKHPQKATLNIETAKLDILKLDRFDQFDVVVSNFFLNVFDQQKMNTLLTHLSKLCTSGGQIIIGDFYPANGNFFDKVIQNIYWYSAATAFFAIAGNAIHKIYDYQPLLEKSDITVVEEQTFKVMGRSLYYALRGIKQ